MIHALIGIAECIGLVLLAGVIIALAWRIWLVRSHRAWLRTLPPVAATRPQLIPPIRFYRALGFFRQYQDLSDAELADNIETYHRERFHTSYAPSAELPDLLLLSYDTERVLWEPLHKSADQVKTAYISTLQSWAKISRGAFLPHDIKETWLGKRGPIQVDFTLAGTLHHLRPRSDVNWIDPSLLPEINQLISESAYQFELCDSDILHEDREAYIIVLTADEKRKLEQERGWRFVEYSALSQEVRGHLDGA